MEGERRGVSAFEVVKEMCAVSRTHEPHAQAHDVYMEKNERYTELCDVMKGPWDHMYRTVEKIQE